MKKFLSWLFSVDAHIKRDIAYEISRQVTSGNVMLRKEIQDLIEYDAVGIIVAEKVERILQYRREEAIEAHAEQLVKAAWNKKFENEDFIDSVVDRIKRKQL